MGANARGVSRESPSQTFRYIGYLETGSAISMFNTTTLQGYPCPILDFRIGITTLSLELQNKIISYYRLKGTAYARLPVYEPRITIRKLPFLNYFSHYYRLNLVADNVIPRKMH